MHMIFRLDKKTSLTTFIMVSLAGHLIGGYLTGILGPFDLREPVPLRPAISVTLETPSKDPSPAANSGRHAQKIKPDPEVPADTVDEKRKDDSPIAMTQGEGDDRQIVREPASETPVKTRKSNSESPERAESTTGVSVSNNKEEADFAPVPVLSVKKMEQGPVRSAGEFVPFAREKLTYRVVLFGIPAGTAVMEATNISGEVRITVRVTSNEAVSSIYPVDISTDTRLMNGNYLLTRISRHEGGLFSDTGFTLMLRERNAFWVDRLKNRYANSPLPREDVMDIISGFYYLRNQRLEVGRPVLLHLFDSCRYAPTTVEVLRKEHLHLPGFREADTVVVHPVLKTDGFFGRSGEILVWLTDDEKKVPVKMEAQISLGKVNAELVSAETEKTTEAAPRGSALEK